MLLVYNMNIKNIQKNRDSITGTEPRAQGPKVGIGSYAFRYHIGFKGFEPPHRMDLAEFLDTAVSMGLGGVQLCENLDYSAIPVKELQRQCRPITESGMFLEIGMRDMSYENLMDHVELASALQSDLIRVVAGKPRAFPETEREQLKEQLLAVFGMVLPELRDRGIRIGLENHYDLPTEDLVGIAERVGDEHVGLVFDTTNGLGFIERPQETLEMVLPYLLSVHVKDYVVEKVEAGYLIRGARLGEGLLDFKSLLRRVLRERPSSSIILEMTIRRDEGMSVEEAVEWERREVERSASALQSFIAEECHV
jgi:sugar phosphate isomerase/epimerase